MPLTRVFTISTGISIWSELPSTRWYGTSGARLIPFRESVGTYLKKKLGLFRLIQDYLYHKGDLYMTMVIQTP